MAMKLPSTGDKAAVVEAMFDRIAARYDLMNRLMTFGMDRRWRRLTIDAVHLQRGHLLVDLACGTGDLAQDAAARGAEVIGVDFSAGMLDGARRRGVDAALLRADAAALPLADASCDALVSGFALRNFVDIAAAMAEAARILKPGGRIGLLEVDRPRLALLRYGHGFYFNKVVPLLGRLLSDGEAYSYLPSSVVYLPEEEQMRSILEGCGFEAVTKRSMLGGAVQLLSASRSAAQRFSRSPAKGLAANAAGGSVEISASGSVPRIERRSLELAGDIDVLKEVSRFSGEPVFYWENPRRSLAIGAVGSAYEIVSEGPARFEKARACYEQLRSRSRSLGDEELPLLVGGFAFADHGSSDPRWRGFPPLRLFVPRLMWVKSPAGAVAVLSWTAGEEEKSESLYRRVESAAAAAGGGVAAHDGSRNDSGLDPGGRSVAEPGADQARTALAPGGARRACEVGAVVSPAADDEGRSAWASRFESVAALIAEGTLSKVVLARSRRLELARAPRPAELLAPLRETRPACTDFWISSEDRHLIGSSPEMLLRVGGGLIEADAVAGTIARGSDPGEDAARARMLAKSGKDLREHELVVDSMVASLEKAGCSVKRPASPEIMSLPEAHHLRTPLRAKLESPLSALDAAALLHPTPAVCGVPTRRAYELLSREESWRGWYTGALGWLSASGSGEFTVSLRSALLGENEAWVWAGAGIVSESRVEAEFDETENKLRAMLTQLGGDSGERAA